MRIAIDIRALMEGKTTGVEVYLTNLLHALFRLDPKNSYILWANSSKHISLPEFKYPNVKVLVTKYPNKFFNLMQKLGFPKIEKLTGPVDLFFSPHWRLLASGSTPLVVTFHDLVSEFAPQFFTWRRRVWHKFMNHRRAAAIARKIIAVSENTKTDLCRIYNVPPEKIKVIYPGLNLETHTNVDPKHFLYLGTFEPRKNIEAVVSSYAAYLAESSARRPLIIAGWSGWKTKVEIPENIREHVQVIGNIDESLKSDLYRQAFAFVFPSFYEGFGFPVLEAAGYGVPVITSYNSSLAEVAADFALFANPFRPSDIAQAMLELERDKDLRTTLSEKSRTAVARYNWNETAKNTLRVFEEAVV